MYDNAMLKMGLPFVTPFIDDRLSTFSAAKARFRILDLLKVSFLYRLIMVNTHQTTHLREYVLYVLYVLLFQTSSANLSTAYKGPRVRFRKGISGRDVFFFFPCGLRFGIVFFLQGAKSSEVSQQMCSDQNLGFLLICRDCTIHLYWVGIVIAVIRISINQAVCHKGS